MNPLAYAQQQGYMGKSIPDPIGQYPGECVSWFKDYFVYRGVPYADLYVPEGAAKNLWLQTTPALLKHFDKVNSPQIGDAAIYDGNFGDVALVCNSGEVVGQMNLNPAGKPNLVPMATRSLGSPMGYLRLKGGSMNITKEQIEAISLMANNTIPGSGFNYAQYTDVPATQALLDQLINEFVPYSEKYHQEYASLQQQVSNPPGFTPYTGTLYVKS